MPRIAGRLILLPALAVGACGRNASPIARDPSPVVAPVPRPDAPALSRPDAIALLRSLHREQDRFEATRRYHLPQTMGLRPAYWDEVVGRFRFWHGDDPSFRPPADHPRVVAAREALLTQLGSGAARMPEDPWIAGQRVRYLVEQEDYDGALAASRECLAAAWWCGALEGFVQHAAGRYTEAEHAFHRALSTAPDTVRCAWTDLTILLDADLRRAYDDLDCEGRMRWNERLWWLADPLYSVPGNERLTEHYARHVVVRMLRDAATPHEVTWGSDREELTLRYGWTIHWSRDRTGTGSLAGGGVIVGHHRPGSQSFLPPPEVVAAPAVAASGRWDTDPYRPRTRYAPAYARTFGRIAGESAAFARGDSALYVVAFALDVPSDDVDRPVTGPFEVAVAFQQAPATPLLTRVGSAPAGATARLVLTVPRTGGIAGIEARSATDSLAARDRFWLPLDSLMPLGKPSVALLLLESDAGSPRTALEAAGAARPTNVYVPGEGVAVYWETADFPPGSPRTVSLTVVREFPGLLRRAAAWLGLAEAEHTEVTLHWDERDPLVAGALGRAVSFRLPDDREGRYRIRLVAHADGVTARTERAFLIRR